MSISGQKKQPLLARCYCGATRLTLEDKPLGVAVCHCSDCRRWTGSPLPAFVAAQEDQIGGLTGQPASFAAGVDRWNCTACGSPIAARFDYIAGQIYLPLGLFDEIAALTPDLECHRAGALPWITLPDLPGHDASARHDLAGLTHAECTGA